MEQSELFPLSLESSLLAWLPDESLFSLLSRIHRLWGYAHAESTVRVLFGRRVQIHSGLASQLGLLETRTLGLLGTADQIASVRTLYAYYASFLPAMDRAALLRAMCDPAPGSRRKWPFGFGNHARTAKPLKACMHCMEEDEREHGVAYWHLTHQYPGSWICTRHGTPLLAVEFSPTAAMPPHWCLPTIGSLNLLLVATDSLSNAELAALRGLAGLISELVPAMQLRRVDMGKLLDVYRTAMHERDWLSPLGNLRRDSIAPAFVEFVSPLRRIRELASLPATAHEASVLLGRLLRGSHQSFHALRHFVLIAWLFGDAKRFLARFDEINVPDPGQS